MFFIALKSRINVTPRGYYYYTHLKTEQRCIRTFLSSRRVALLQDEILTCSVVNDLT